MAVVGFRLGTSPPSWVHWLICASCDHAYLRVGDRTYPNASVLSTPSFLPPDIGTAWTEVTECLGVNAYTAAAIMSRKILLHVAVEQGLAAANARGKSPTFEEAVDYLEQNHIITPMMKPWVDQVRTSGNVATHELPATPADEALEIAEFTQQLLLLVYEMPGRIAGRRGTTNTDVAQRPAITL